jgi:oligopeptide transport system substrate-binding protein
MYEANHLDVLHLDAPLPTDRNRARQRHAAEYVTLPSLTTYYLGFVVTEPPFDDRRVRRAFVLATDRETLAEVDLGGSAFPATGGFVPPGMPGHSAGIALAYDPRRARGLLAEAGYSDGRGFPVVRGLTYTDPMSSLISQRLQAQWQRNLGVETVWEAVDWGEAATRVTAGVPPHLFWGGIGGSYPDPDSLLRTGFPWPLTRWRNDAYDRLVETARSLAEQGRRMALYRQTDRILVEEAPIMPWFYGRVHLLAKPWVSGFCISPIKRWYWQDVIIEPH